ncbi:MAG: tellurium resistance protein TerC [Pseudomonadota bacterium]
MAEIFTTSGFFTLLALIALQAVLGFDNLLYISIESKRVGDEAKASRVRRWGIGLAIAFRIALLVLIVNLFSLLEEPLFSVPFAGFIEGEFNLQALVTLAGGGFIIYTAVKEIHHLMAVDHIEHTEGDNKKSMVSVISMIVAMNLVFSFDSILSAMAIASTEVAQIVNSAGEVIRTFEGTVTECKASLIGATGEAVACEPGKDYQVWIMATAIILSGVAMILLADYVADFLKKNRMYEILGLFILFIVGVLLVSEGGHLAHLKLFGFSVEAMSKSSFYLVIFVLVVTDVIQTRYQKRLWKIREAELKGEDAASAAEAAIAEHGRIV